MHLETQRLKIIPLSYKQVKKYLLLGNELERELGLNDSCRTITRSLFDAIEKYVLPRMLERPSDFLFSTMWVVVDKKENYMVADLSFKGIPDDAGNIEIGYGTYPAMQNKGYMTEAVRAMVIWAAKQPEVQRVLAETSSDNEASIKVLKNNEFLFIKEVNGMLWWSKEIKYFINTPIERGKK